MKKTICVLCLLPCVAFADLWRGLDEANHYSGPLVTEADLLGKVVLVDEWGVRCPPCRALLPGMESLWSAYKSKPFVLLGSHRQGHQPDQVKELVKANKLTYPIYERAGLADEPSGDGRLPFMYVVNHRGKVVYAGRSHKEATQAVVEALMKIGAPPNLVDGVAFKKYKAIEKQLVLGKPLKGPMAKLAGDVKKAQAKTASAALKEQAGAGRGGRGNPRSHPEGARRHQGGDRDVEADQSAGSGEADRAVHEVVPGRGRGLQGTAAGADCEGEGVCGGGEGQGEGSEGGKGEEIKWTTGLRISRKCWSATRANGPATSRSSRSTRRNWSRGTRRGANIR